MLRSLLTIILAAAAVMLTSDAWAQGACSFMTRAEFGELTGKTEYTDPEEMAYGTGTVCGYGQGQIVFWTVEGSAVEFDRMLEAFGQQHLPRTPVGGLGDGAFAVFFDPEDKYQDHGAFVVFGAGPPTIAVTVYADEGEFAETALPQAVAVAKALALKLP